MKGTRGPVREPGRVHPNLRSGIVTFAGRFVDALLLMPPPRMRPLTESFSGMALSDACRGDFGWRGVFGMSFSRKGFAKQGLHGNRNRWREGDMWPPGASVEGSRQRHCGAYRIAHKLRALVVR